MTVTSGQFDSRNYVGGAWTMVDSDGTFESTSPADPTDVIARFPNATRSAVTGAIDVAVDAEDDWAVRTVSERAGYLRAAARDLRTRRDEIAESMTREMGKPISGSRGEVERAAEILVYYAELARDHDGDTYPSSTPDTLAYTTRAPVGTAGLITPWNFPIAIPAWKLAPALVTGNTAVLKPASNTPATAAELVGAFDNAGLPDGVLNLVTGPGSVVGDEIASNADIDLVSFTGSTTIGNAVHRAATTAGAGVQCEMGGKNPLVVDASADIDRAVELSIGGAFGGAGQACTATSRAIVVEEVVDEYVDRLVDATEALTVGPPLDEGTDIGPKASKSELESDIEYIDVGVDEGATLITGGSRVETPECAQGYYVEPTVFGDVEPEMRIAQEEIFGPVLAVITVDDFEEAVAVANCVEYGLSAGICTNRLDHAKIFADQIEAGVVKVNQTTTGAEFHLPFGGQKKSSTETTKELGRAGLEFYTREKSVYVTH